MLTFVLVTGVILSGVVLLVNRVLMRMLGGSPEYAKAIAHATATGNLSINIRKRPNDDDSLIAGISYMQVQLRAIIGRIQQGAKAITLAMEEVAAGNVDLSQRTEEQAAALQQTSATMAGLRDAIQRTVADAKSAASVRKMRSRRPGEAARKSWLSRRLCNISLRARMRSAISSI